MRVLVTGATGFVGKALCLRLARDGHTVVAWARRPEAVASMLGAAVEAVPATREALATAIENVDAVINLAGEPIAGVRWTAARRRRLVSSRLEATRSVASAVRTARRKPRVLLSTSAVGFYGDRADERLDEKSAIGTGFLAGLCRDWEAEALAASGDTRVAVFRLGIVLGREGGALGKMLPPFRAGAGGRLGNGRQWMSWIHLEDLVEIFARALSDDRFRGVFNATAPQPVTNRDFTKALSRALRMPAIVPVPSIALRLLFGKSASVLLGGQQAVPSALLALGHEFFHPEIDGALRAIVLPEGEASVAPRGQHPRSEYLDRRRPRRVLRTRTELDAPIGKVFDFFSKPENLGALTPAAMKFTPLKSGPFEMREGLTIDYSIRVGPVPLRWRTRIESWMPGAGFVDSQISGPYASWWHEHTFRAEGNRTIMEDTVWYSVPLGPLGAIVERVFVRPMLGRVFGYRADAVRLRFGRSHSGGRVAGKAA